MYMGIPYTPLLHWDFHYKKWRILKQKSTKHDEISEARY